jgi:hypothetical protein
VGANEVRFFSLPVVGDCCDFVFLHGVTEASEQM